MENGSPRPAAKWLEMAANVSIVIVAVVIVIVFARNYFFHPKTSRPEIAAGARLTGQPVNWQDNRKNVVLVLSTTCHYCKESSGFYRKLVEDCRNSHARTVAFFPQTPQEAQAYLKAEDVQVDEVKRANFQSLQIGGTPTLLLVDSNGVVQKVWLGKLPEAKEKEVLDQSCRG